VRFVYLKYNSALSLFYGIVCDTHGLQIRAIGKPTH